MTKPTLKSDYKLIFHSGFHLTATTQFSDVPPITFYDDGKTEKTPCSDQGKHIRFVENSKYSEDQCYSQMILVELFDLYHSEP